MGLNAQSGIKGQIQDPDGQPLAFATLFISQTGTGTVSNEEGFYEIILSPGNYNVVFQYLGYKTIQKKIKVGQGLTTQDIQFSDQPMSLETVEILDGRENPAYTIMRKAIAKADYHRQQLDSYSARIYVKGSGRLIDAPFFLRKRLEKEGIDSTMAFLTESINEVSYERPNTFKEKVISVRSQGNDNDISPMPYINSSFYRKEVADAVSPLSPRAFSYYKFEFEGSYFDRNYEINKIKVIPRRRSEGVFEGTIYIVEDWWSIHSLNLTTFKLGFTFNLEQIYGPIEEKVWMPLTHKIKANGSLMGFDFEYNYLATTSDYVIALNPDLEADFKLIDEKIEKELAEEIKVNQQKGDKSNLQERLASGEPLTRKEMRKMMKEYRKEERKERKEKQKEQQKEETKIVDERTRTFEVDSASQVKDSTFWDAVRPLPLTAYELKSYKVRDSMTVVNKQKDSLKIEKQESGGSSIIGGFFGTLISGNTFKVSKKTDFRIQSIVERTNYNTVERWNTSIPFSLRKKIGKHQKFSINPTYNIAFGPLVQDGNVEVKFEQKKKFRNYKISTDIGDAIFQFNPENPVDLLTEETWFSLYWENNLAKFYQKRYWNGKIEGQWSDRFSGGIQIEWSDRTALFNNENAKPWRDRNNREFTPNNPFNLELNQTQFGQHSALVGSANISWAPFKDYFVSNGERRIRANSGPEFQLTYRKGFNETLGSEVDYDLVIGQVNLDHEFPAGSRLMLEVSAGMFLNKNQLYFPDFHHFRGNQTIIMFEKPIGNFRALPYYQHSTGDRFFELHAFQQFRNLLITQIPEAWMLGLKENLMVSYLKTPSTNHYIELGYGLDNIYKIFRAEVGASFLDGKYEGTFFRVGIASGLNISSNNDEDGGGGISIGM